MKTPEQIAEEILRQTYASERGLMLVIAAAIQAERDRAEKFEAALQRVNVIRNSIVGAQSVNWSEHIYPLVAALNGAGFVGMDYPEAKANIGTLLERIEKSERDLAEAEKLLEPFAAATTGNKIVDASLHHCRAARAFLERRKGVK